VLICFYPIKFCLFVHTVDMDGFAKWIITQYIALVCSPMQIDGVAVSSGCRRQSAQ
jgi:hypothetical protein